MTGAGQLWQRVSRLNPIELDAFLLFLWHLSEQRGPLLCVDVQRARYELVEVARAAEAKGFSELAASCLRAAQQSHSPQ